jgi:hypothetical protein
MQRRDFLKSSVLASFALTWDALAETKHAPKSELFSGIQIAPHSFFDEGIEYSLDLLRETAAINALLISTHSYYGAMGRPREVLADHGVPLADNTKRTLPSVWVKHRDAYFKDTFLRHTDVDTKAMYADRNLFDELAPAAQKRGIKLYLRWYEPSAKAADFIKNWDKVITVDAYGNPGDQPCWFHPEYQRWMTATMKDLFENYPVDGIQYGAERKDPLSGLWAFDAKPSCFCEHCKKQAKALGIRIEKAREGFIKLDTFMGSLKVGKKKLPDGTFSTFLGILLQNPDILVWNQLYFKGSEEFHKLAYDTIKSVRNVPVGRHVDHRQSSWGLIYRASLSYGQMAQYADFIKPILYQEIFGIRLKKHIDFLRDSILNEMPSEQMLQLFYTLFGHDPKIEPTFEDLDKNGLSPEYVFQETRRCIAGVEGKIPVYAGIGMDIPTGGEGWGTHKWQSDPEKIYQSVKRALDAGAGGVVASREYEEISLSSLRAMGNALRDHHRQKPS